MNDSIQLRNSKIIFGSLIEGNFSQVLKEFEGSKFAIITDENVAELWVEYLVTEFEELNRAEIITVPAGEESKQPEIYFSVLQSLADVHFGRQDVVINLGGGVVSDLGGFAASTYKRGIRFINIPTTLLAMVDASIGGKTGIDAGNIKNLIGTFAEPKAIFIDPAFLSTLKEEEIISASAEMLKHGLIADKNYFFELQNVPVQTLRENITWIKKSVEIKAQIVSQDFDEKNIRKSLNFGHTIGHAIESYYLEKNQPVLHGYAVAAGMIFESRLAHKKNLLNTADLNVIENTLQPFISLFPNQKPNINDLTKYLKNDKKNLGESIGFALLEGIGQIKIDCKAELSEIENVLHW